MSEQADSVPSVEQGEALVSAVGRFTGIVYPTREMLLEIAAQVDGAIRPFVDRPMVGWLYANKLKSAIGECAAFVERVRREVRDGIAVENWKELQISIIEPFKQILDEVREHGRELKAERRRQDRLAANMGVVEKTPPVLDDTDCKILRAGVSRVAETIFNLATNAEINRDTVSERLPRLVEYRLMEVTGKKRMKYHTSDKGKARLSLS